MRFLVIAALAVAGCHAASDNGQKQAVEQTPKHPWKKLPDGSWGWLEASPSEKFANEQAERCWPSKGRWDCLSASTLVQVGDMEPPTVFASGISKPVTPIRQSVLETMPFEAATPANPSMAR